MNAKILNKTVISEQYLDKFKNFNGWPSVVKLSDNTIMAAWSNRFFHVCPFGAVQVAYSYDNGLTWTKPTVLFDSPLDDRDGGLCAFGDNKVCLTSFTNSRAMQRNYIKVEAHKYIDPSDIEKMEQKIDSITDADEQNYLGGLYAISNDGGKTFGEFKLIPITAPHGPFILPDGNMAYLGCNFSDVQKASFDYLDKGLYLCFADENGVFGEPKFITNPQLPSNAMYCEPHAVSASDGRIVAHIRVEGAGNPTVYQSFSFDNGKSFTEFKPTGIDGAPSQLIKLADGRLLVSYSRRHSPCGQYVRLSDDCGETWGEEILINEAYEWDQGYACTCQTADNNFVTVFYQRDQGEKVGNKIHAVLWALED